MISENQTKVIVNGMNSIFPKATPRVNAKAGGGAYGITTVVPSIDSDAYKQLGALLDETSTKVTLKRSGTGISVLVQ